MNIRTSSLAAATFAVCAAMSAGVAKADAIAQAWLKVENFQIVPTLNAGANIAVTSVTNTGDVSASFGGAAATTGSGSGAFNLSVAQGPNQGLYNPGVSILSPVAPAGAYSGSASQLSGDALAPGGATALTDDTVALKPQGTGTTQSNVNLSSRFVFTVAGSSVNLSFAFNASSFLRAYLDLPAGTFGGTNASTDWNLKIKPASGSGVIFDWTPNGSVGGAGGVGGSVGGVETLDGFNMNDGVFAGFSGDDSYTANSAKSFAATTGNIGPGTYVLTINHKSAADAKILPEPGVLSLAGLALLGVAFSSRRRRA